MKRAAVVLAAVLAAGCGAPRAEASCAVDAGPIAFCYEYDNATPDGLQMLMDFCASGFRESVSGPVDAAPYGLSVCAPHDKLGGCRHVGSNGTRSYVWFYPGTAVPTASEIQAACLQRHWDYVTPTSP